MINGNAEKLKDYVFKHKNDKNMRFYWDIETLLYNKKMAIQEKKPTKFKNVTYSFAIAWESGNEIEKAVFPNLKTFMDVFLSACKATRAHFFEYSCKAKIEMIAHNGNKYDNHFLLHDLLFYYPFMKRANIFLKQAVNNDNTLKMTDLKKERRLEKKGIIFEKRVKSRTNLELEFFLHGIYFKTTDSLMKTNMSIKALGEKLFGLNLITEAELKTDFAYDIFDSDDDMSEYLARQYAEQRFKELTDQQYTYIYNDVIILAKVVIHYEKLFLGFNFEKITFTSNILTYYNDNDLTSFQLLNRSGSREEGNQVVISYTDYYFGNENLYDYLKSFYRGGLNFFNMYLLGEHITEEIFAIDLNSSYPYAMYAFDIPTFLIHFEEYDTPTQVAIDTSKKTYFLYRMSKMDFNNEILMEIDSVIVKQMLTKYYNTNDYVNINTYTLKTIELFIKRKITTLPILSLLEYECVPFGSKEKIAEKYFVKTQGKLKNKIIMTTPMDYVITDEMNTHLFTQEEIDNSKVVMNGLYGIPALRAYFNLFKITEDERIENEINGFKNSERNILFSTFVTSVAFHNLLYPLTFLTPQEIDRYVIYMDTDSLYMYKTIKHKLPASLFDDHALGKWGIDSENITDFYVLNHKKYAYYDKTIDKKTGKEKGIIVKAGGIPAEAFDKNMSFVAFIETQFSDGCTIKNTKGILNEQGTISIYESETTLEIGKKYATYFTKHDEQRKKDLIEKIRNETGGEFDGLYIESEIGFFSQSEINAVTHSIENKSNLYLLKAMNNRIKFHLENVS